MRNWSGMPMGTTARYRRRGASYVFFLGTAMLVTVIGLSALTVVRVKRQGAEAVNDHVAARIYAQSAVEQGLLAIYSNDKWRDLYAHNTWSATQSIGAGMFAWKLVDEINNSLTLDRNARLRVYGKGARGPSTWIYSVEVQPPPEAVLSNLLSNGDLETGFVTPWWATGCILNVDNLSKHSGANGLFLGTRTSVTASACQTIKANLQQDSPLQVMAWIKTRTTPETINVGVRVLSDAGWQYFAIGSLSGTTTWQQVQGTFTPAWTGLLQDAYLEIAGTILLQEILIDDVSLKRAPGAVGIVPGTWRREAKPLNEIM